MIDTINKYMVGARGDDIAIMAPRTYLKPDDALLLAAWLVAMAEHKATHKFQEVLDAVCNT